MVEACALLRQHSNKLNVEEMFRFLYETCQDLGLMKELLKLPLAFSEQVHVRMTSSLLWSAVISDLSSLSFTIWHVYLMDNTAILISSLMACMSICVLKLCYLQEALEKFLQDTGGSQNKELLVVHYLQRANYVPALQLNQALKMNLVVCSTLFNSFILSFDLLSTG